MAIGNAFLGIQQPLALDPALVASLPCDQKFSPTTLQLANRKQKKSGQMISNKSLSLTYERDLQLETHTGQRKKNRAKKRHPVDHQLLTHVNSVGSFIDRIEDIQTVEVSKPTFSFSLGPKQKQVWDSFLELNEEQQNVWLGVA